MNESKRKGLTTELQCQTFFTQLGYNVSIPLGEDCRYDLIVDVEGILIRVQVKTCTEDGNGIKIPCRSTQSNTQETKNNCYNKEQIDYFATYYNNQCYLIRVEECSTVKKLSFSDKRTNQYASSFIDDYLAEKQIQKILDGTDDEILEDRKIYQYDLRNNLIATYNSCKEAAIVLGKENGNGHIGQVIRGIRKTAYGYKWTDTLIKG